MRNWPPRPSERTDGPENADPESFTYYTIRIEYGMQRVRRAVSFGASVGARNFAETEYNEADHGS